MHPWHSPANWYSPVQNPTQHHELRKTWEGACNEKLEEKLTTIFQTKGCKKYTPLHHPGLKIPYSTMS